MDTFVVYLTEPVEIPSGAMSDVVEHEGHVDVEGGALLLRPGPFQHPTAGYAPGAWFRFKKKEG